MTDDGETANRLMHPSHRIEKTYIVDVVGENIRAAVRRMREPLDIDGCMVQAIDVQMIRQGGGRGQLEVVIGEGRNRQDFGGQFGIGRSACWKMAVSDAGGDPENHGRVRRKFDEDSIKMQEK